MIKLNVDPKKLRLIARKSGSTVEEVERRIIRLIQSSTISVSNTVKFLMANSKSTQGTSEY